MRAASPGPEISLLTGNFLYRGDTGVRSCSSIWSWIVVLSIRNPTLNSEYSLPRLARQYRSPRFAFSAAVL